MEDQDKDSKTEEPTEKKIRDSIEKGQVANSREVNSFFMILALTLLILFIMPYTLRSTINSLGIFIANCGDIMIDKATTGLLFQNLLYKVLIYISPLFISVMIIALFSSYLQQGEFIFSSEPLKPDISKLSLIKGFKKLFSKKSLVEFIKSFLKILTVGICISIIIYNNIQEINQYPDYSVDALLFQMYSMTLKIMMCVCVILSIMAFFDFIYQKYEHIQSLKMTKQEVKDEYKQTEGDPEIKHKIKALRREQIKRNIATNVPKSTVVITNPEHYAVALKYEKGDSVPVVVTKGLDLIAQSIKQLARDHDIPIVEDPPLAQMLYKTVEIDEMIKPEHYEAVAKIIGYVMSKKNNSKL
ncbi:MAG: flagellar biosynthesis protein FlhB [Rickettsiaceae bacterium]